MNNTEANDCREFLKKAAIVSIGFAALSRCTMSTGDTSQPLLGQALKADPKGYLDLPEGFSYKVIFKSGQAMSDGLRVPGRPDGMEAAA